MLIIIYLNGIKVINSANSPFLPYDSSTKLNFIGYSSNSILDELKIYNYALSASDVLLDFNESSKNGKLINNNKYYSVLPYFSLL